MDDYWNVQGEKELSDSWVGKTVFYILRTPPEPGFTYIYGRKTKIQSDTNRPGDMWPEVWNDLGKGKKKKAIEKWKITKVKLQEARDKRDVGLYVSADDQEYVKIISELKAKLDLPAAPAMPVVSSIKPSACVSHIASLVPPDFGQGQPLGRRKRQKLQRAHQERVAPRGHASPE